MLQERMTKKVLINYGGWEGHEPEQCSALFANVMRNEGFTVDAVSDLDPISIMIICGRSA